MWSCRAEVEDMGYDFKCEFGHLTEAKLSITQSIPLFVECADCGRAAYRVYYPVPFVMKA
tara:strand:+ start:431 stop:610 length:180 start_codon:yes stop_codon:yes gene_type:complete